MLSKIQKGLLNLFSNKLDEQVTMGVVTKEKANKSLHDYIQQLESDIEGVLDDYSGTSVECPCKNCRLAILERPRLNQ